jgi:hypothetical protein
MEVVIAVFFFRKHNEPAVPNNKNIPTPQPKRTTRNNPRRYILCGRYAPRITLSKMHVQVSSFPSTTPRDMSSKTHRRKKSRKGKWVGGGGGGGGEKLGDCLDFYEECF